MSEKTDNKEKKAKKSKHKTMSHSAFSLSANEPCVNNRNLVIVVKKDGTLAADQEALQELLGWCYCP